MVRMVKTQQLSFEHLTRYVKQDLPEVRNDARVWDAFRSRSQLAARPAEDAVAFGKPPLLFIADLGTSYGLFHPSKPDVIKIGRQLVKDFEEATSDAGTRRVLEATILHELVHWALNAANIPERENGASVEMGVRFEEDAYGERVLRETELIHDRHEERGELGSLSRRFESQGDPGARGHDANGGWSYGLYQLASNKGQVAKFLAFLSRSDATRQAFARRLEDAGGDPAARAGTEEMRLAWRELASDPLFADAQHDYIKSTHYDVFADDLARKGFDLEPRSDVLKDVAWSVSVQHGPHATGLFTRPLASLSPALRQDDRALVKAIYADRMRVDVHFASSTEATKRSVARRFEEEREEALRRLEA